MMFSPKHRRGLAETVAIASVLVVFVAGCHAKTFGVPHSDADLCVAESASVCTALNGAHQCTDGKGEVCVLCWPPQRDLCPLDGVTSGDVVGGLASSYFVCVLQCDECARDPREVALGIKCDAPTPPGAPPPGPADLGGASSM
jgi:hypothetical protein